MTKQEIAELINRRQRQVLVHSIIYYKLNANLISDAQWAAWALELEELQAKYPEIALEQRYGKAFVDFDHSTGMSLPLEDPDAVYTARMLLDIANRRN